MRDVEAAANVLCVQDMQPGPANMLAEVAPEIRESYIGLARRVLSAVFVARVGCDQCGGTNRRVQVLTKLLEDVPIAMPTAIEGPCPAEHVELPNPYGGTVVYADPDKCAWRDVAPNNLDMAVVFVGQRRDATERCYFGAWHNIHCGWVPRPLEVEQ